MSYGVARILMRASANPLQRAGVYETCIKMRTTQISAAKVQCEEALLKPQKDGPYVAWVVTLACAGTSVSAARKLLPGSFTIDGMGASAGRPSRKPCT